MNYLILTFVHFDICIGLIAVPQDNRQIYVHDLNGHKLTRLPRDSTKSHHRMVSAVCWAPDAEPVENWRSKANLFSAGFTDHPNAILSKPAENRLAFDLQFSTGSASGAQHTADTIL